MYTRTRVQIKRNRISMNKLFININNEKLTRNAIWIRKDASFFCVGGVKVKYYAADEMIDVTFFTFERQKCAPGIDRLFLWTNGSPWMFRCVNDATYF